MTDWGINRNGSNYAVPTEAAAIKAADMVDAQAPKTGEIWSRRNGKTGETEYSLVIASSGNAAVFGKLYDSERFGRVQIIGRTICWFDPMRLLYAYNGNSNMEYIKTISEADMDAVRKSLARAFGIVDQSENAEPERNVNADRIAKLEAELKNTQTLCTRYRKLYEAAVMGK